MAIYVNFAFGRSIDLANLLVLDQYPLKSIFLIGQLIAPKLSFHVGNF